MTLKARVAAILTLAIFLSLHANAQYKVVPQTGHNSTVLAIEYSPDGKYLATAGHDKVVLLWDTKTNLHYPLPGHTVGVDRLVFSPDNKYLASSDFAGELKVWDLATRKALYVMERGAKEESFSKIQFVNNDEIAVQNSTMLKFWNFKSNTYSKKIPLKANHFTLHPKEATVLLLESSAYASAAGTYTPGGKMVLYDYSKLAPMDDSWLRKIGTGWFRAEFSTSGKYLTLLSETELVLVDYPSKKLLWRTPIEFGPAFLIFSADESLILTGGNPDTPSMFVYERSTGKETQRVGNFTDFDFGFHPQLQIAAGVHDNSDDPYLPDCAIDIYDLKSKRIIKSYQHSSYDIHRIKWDEEKRQLFVEAHKKEWVWDMSAGSIIMSGESGELQWQGKGTGTERRAKDGGIGQYVSPMEKYAAYFGNGIAKITDYRTDNDIATIKSEVGIAGITFSHNSDRLFLTTGDDLLVYDIASKQQVRSIHYDKASVGALAASPDGKILAIGKFQNERSRIREKFYIADYSIDLIDPSTYQVVKTLEGHQQNVTFMNFTADSKYLISSSLDGSIRWWDTQTGKQKFVLYGNSESEYFIGSEDGYYSSSKAGIERIAFDYNGRMIPGKLFEVQMNRPDKVVAALGYSTPSMISAYKKAFEKRIAQLGITEQQVKVEELPVVNVTNIPPPSVAVKKVQVDYEAIDNLNELNHIRLTVNNVPVFGRKGLSVKAKKSTKGKLEIELTEGVNKIEIAVVNAKGASSVPVSFDVFCTVKTRPDLYLITIGIDKFLDQEYNLSYAAKDANDIAALFESRKANYGNLVHLPFIGMQATKEKILAARATLEKSKPDDQVIIFAATHGLLDENYNYYLATYNMVFDKPAFQGLAYNDLEGMLEGIPARKKMILLDACHSGEVDATEITASTEAVKDVPGVKARGFKPVKKASNVGLENTFDLMKNLFADLREGSGATVISSAGGVEFAIESEEWNNGAFTSAILEAIKSKRADENTDASITVEELKKYVFARVIELTNGKQHPTSRIDNIDNDFTIVSTIANTANASVYSMVGRWKPKEMALYEGEKFEPVTEQMNKSPMTITKGADGFYYVNWGRGDIKLTQDDVNTYKNTTGDVFRMENANSLVIRGYYSELTRYVKE